MTIQQFRKLLEENILYLGSLDEFRNESEVIEQICDESYRHAVELNLTDCIAAWQPGLLGLMAMREALPDPDVFTLKEAAEYIGYTESGLRKLVTHDRILHKQDVKGGPILFKKEWLDAFLTPPKPPQPKPAKATPPVESQFGFDPALLS